MQALRATGSSTQPQQLLVPSTHRSSSTQLPPAAVHPAAAHPHRLAKVDLGLLVLQHVLDDLAAVHPDLQTKARASSNTSAAGEGQRHRRQQAGGPMQQLAGRTPSVGGAAARQPQIAAVEAACCCFQCLQAHVHTAAALPRCALPQMPHAAWPAALPAAAAGLPGCTPVLRSQRPRSQHAAQKAAGAAPSPRGCAAPSAAPACCCRPAARRPWWAARPSSAAWRWPGSGAAPPPSASVSAPARRSAGACGPAAGGEQGWRPAA